MKQLLSYESKKALGNFGEDIATEFLEKNNYKILARNFRVRSAEIDIIAQKNSVIIFVEVKTRTNILYGSPAEAVNIHKQQKIIEAANAFLQVEIYSDYACRFDVIEVYFSKNRVEKINHIKDAFEIVI